LLEKPISIFVDVTHIAINYLFENSCLFNSAVVGVASLKHQQRQKTNYTLDNQQIS